MKHRTLRCAAETLVLLLIAAMAVFLAAGLHQRAPDGALSTLSTGWYQLTDGVRREVTLPAALEAGPGQTITLYNDTLTDSDGGKVLSARGVEYGIEIRAGETLLYRYEDNAFPKNAQMKGRLWADTELPYGLGGQTLSLTFTELPGRMCRIDAPVLGSMPAVTGRHIQSSLFSAGMILVMLVLAVLALLIFLYMSFYGIRERRFLDTAVFLLLCSLWCLTDSGLYQLYGADTAAGSVVSFYAFMTMAIPMVHFVRNTVSGRLRLVPDVCIALLCINALAQGAAYRLFGVPFIDMLPLTHLLLTAGVAAMLTVLFRSYRAQPAPQLRLRMAAFAALGAFGVAALVLYWLLHIYWYDAVYQFGVLLFIILLLHGLISQAAEDMRFHMEHRISHQMQREDRMTGLPNRRAFEEYMERIRTGEAGCLDAVLTYIRLEGLNERNDRFGLQAGDEAVIAAARCVSDFCRECEDEGESVLCAKPLFLSELRRVLAEPFRMEEQAEQTENAAEFAGKRLLVVEDNALNREIAVTMLEEAGFAVDTAENGKLAVDKVRESAPGYYDLVLMDIQMPVMNGYEATRAIRALPDAEKAALPIVAITANAFDEDRQNAAKAGMNGHLSKPFDMQQLLAMIEEVL